MNPQDKIRKQLKRYFEKAREADSSYSLRSLARMLEVPPGNLSVFFAGKRNFSPQTLEKIALRISDSLEVQVGHRLVSHEEIIQLNDDSQELGIRANIPLDSMKLEQVREIFRKFQEDLSSVLEERDADSIYRLSILFCPTKK